MERKTSALDRVVGGTPEEKQEIFERSRKAFQTQYLFGRDGESIETEKSRELSSCIESITRCMHGFLAEYDVTALDMRPDQVHVIKKEKMALKPGDIIAEAGGYFDPKTQQVVVFEPTDPLTHFASVHFIVHEMVHANSFVSVQVSEAGEGEGEGVAVKRRRIGLQTRSGGFDHFNELNEAVTEELALRFGHQYFTDIGYATSAYARALQATNETEETVGTLGQYDFGVYKRERERLAELVNDIYWANQDAFESPEAVFREFAKSMLNGKLLPIARLIEKTYGKGRFAELAEEMERLIK